MLSAHKTTYAGNLLASEKHTIERLQTTWDVLKSLSIFKFTIFVRPNLTAYLVDNLLETISAESVEAEQHLRVGEG